MSYMRSSVCRRLQESGKVPSMLLLVSILRVRERNGRNEISSALVGNAALIPKRGTIKEIDGPQLVSSTVDGQTQRQVQGKYGASQVLWEGGPPLLILMRQKQTKAGGGGWGVGGGGGGG